MSANNPKLINLFETSSTTSNNSIEDGSFDQYRSDDSRVSTNKKKLAVIGRGIAIEDSPLVDLRVPDSVAKKDYNGNMKSAYLSDSSMNKYDDEDIDPSGDSTAQSSSNKSTRTVNSADDSPNDSEVVYKSPKKKLIIKSDSESDEDEENEENESDGEDEDDESEEEDEEEDDEEEEEEEEESFVQPKPARPVKKVIPPQDESILYETKVEKQNETLAQRSALNYRDASAKKIISDDEDVQEVDGSGSENDNDDENDEDYVVPKEARDSIAADKELSEVQAKFANDSDIIDISDTPVKLPSVKSISNSTMMNESMKKPFPIFESVTKKDREIAGWSPNYEKVKAKVEQSKKLQEENTRKMQTLELDEKKSEQVGNVLKDLKYHSVAIRGPNVQITNRNLGYEGQLKYLSDELLKVLETKPNPDVSFDDFKPPRGIKVSLLAHQR